MKRIVNTRQKGVVLISVLLIVALATIVATQMSTRIMGQLQRASNLELNQQAYWYALGAEAFAKRVILTVVDEDPEFINLSQNRFFSGVGAGAAIFKRYTRSGGL